MENKRILVTGGAGFIGTNLCRRLLDEGHYVICIDNFYSGDYHNVLELSKNKHFTFVYHDMREEYYAKVDEIYHLACPASPKFYQRNPIFTLETSFKGAENVLRLALRNNCKVLLASTSEVYGDALEHPQQENYWGNVNPIGIRSCYDEGKRCAEALFMDFHRRFGVKTKIIRIFNTYGPYMRSDDGRVVSNLIMQALNREKLTVYGDGRQTRSFQYIDDLIEGMMKVMESNDENTGPYNIGNPNETDIRTLADKIIRLSNESLDIEFKELPKDDPHKRKPDINRMKEDFGWGPVVSLEEGLKKTFSYFQDVVIKSQNERKNKDEREFRINKALYERPSKKEF